MLSKNSPDSARRKLNSAGVSIEVHGDDALFRTESELGAVDGGAKKIAKARLARTLSVCMRNTMAVIENSAGWSPYSFRIMTRICSARTPLIIWPKTRICSDVNTGLRPRLLFVRASFRASLFALESLTILSRSCRSASLIHRRQQSYALCAGRQPALVQLHTVTIATSAIREASLTDKWPAGRWNHGDIRFFGIARIQKLSREIASFSCGP